MRRVLFTARGPHMLAGRGSAMLRQAQSIKNDGVFYSTTRGDLKAPLSATRDIAAVGTRLLLDDTWSGPGEVPVLGPEDLSSDDMAQIMTEVLGRPVRYQQLPTDGYYESLIGRGRAAATSGVLLPRAGRRQQQPGNCGLGA